MFTITPRPRNAVGKIVNPTWAASILIGALLLVLLGAGGYLTWRDYIDALSRARLRTENAVVVIAEHARWLIETSQLILLRVDEAIEDPANPKPDDSQTLRALLSTLPVDALIFTINAHGYLTSQTVNNTLNDVSDRDFFQFAAQGETWHIGKQITGRISGRKIFTISRRLERNNQFAGVAVIGIPMDAMSHFYQTLGFGPKSAVGLIGFDGWVITRHPQVPESFSTAGLPDWSTIRNTERVFLEADAQAVDGQSYFLAAHHLPSFRLISVVAFSLEEALESFHTRLADIAITGLIGFIILSALLTWVILLLRHEANIRHKLAAALLEKEQTQIGAELALEAGQLGMWQIEPPNWDGRYSENMARFYGLPPKKLILTGKQSRQLIERNDVKRVAKEFQAAIAHEKRFDSEFRICRPDGEIRWLASKGTIIRDDTGNAIQILGVCQDITERKKFEDRQRLLIAELNHRVKNVLAVVQSIAWQTFEQNNATEIFIGRISSLAKAHNLLADSQWKGASLTTLITRQFEAYINLQSKQVTFSGPDILLNPKTTQSLSLILHELTTNAAKYGALSSDVGCLSVNWFLKNNETPHLNFHWNETGLTGVTPPIHPGFGTRLIQRSITHELGGEVQFEYLPSGMKCSLLIPLPEIQMAEKIKPPIGSDPVKKTSSPINGQRVLLVEDSVLVAMDMERLLESNGVTVVGPAYRLDAALHIAESDNFEAAVLDLNLDGDMVFPVADVLIQRKIPFFFMTGYGDADNLPDTLKMVRRISKPVQGKELLAALVATLEKNHPPP